MTGTNRRDILRLAGGALTGARRPAAQVRGRPPNILFILSDEHTHFAAGCYGNKLARTPNLDRLAEQGITFENAYCNSPQCAPSRLSLTAGKYIHRVGAWNNYSRLPGDDIPSLPRILNAAGYETYLCGKQHYDRRHRYGFTEIGKSSSNEHDMTGRGKRRRADDVTAAPLHPHLASLKPGGDSKVLAHDRIVAENTVDFLSKRAASDKPFFLLAGFIAPHPPFTVPASYWELQRGKHSMPEMPEGFLDSLPLNYKHLRRDFGLLDVPEAAVLRARELYFGLTQWMDENCGRILDALRQRPFADNTVVIYATDHGENLGEHGLWWKIAMYEQSAHIPLIVSWPKRWAGGQRRRGACSLLDLVQTIAALGGAQTPEDWDGRSMLRWMDDPAAPWKDIAVSQYYGEKVASGFAMVRAGPWKYVYHSAPDSRHPAERELYNLESDPKEFHNLAGDSSQRERMERLHAQLVKELGEHPDETERRCRFDIMNGYT